MRIMKTILLEKAIKRKFRFFLIFFFLVIASISSNAQYYTKHYIAPASWQYFSDANDLVIATNSTAPTSVDISRSDGTAIATVSVVSGAPAVYRFVGDPGSLYKHPLNTVINGAGIIVTSSIPVSVNYRNIASDANGDGPAVNPPYIKGNASLTSYGDAGLGYNFRVGYYRNGTINGALEYPTYGVMAITDGTAISINGVATTTLNAGQSYIFQANIGTLLTASNLVVMNTGILMDQPNGCGDGTLNQIPPVEVLGDDYYVVRTNGNSTAEQSTVVATENNTALTINTFLLSGAFLSSTTVTLANAGDFYTFANGDGTNPYSANEILSTKNVVVYTGSAQDCEVDVLTLAPVNSPCNGSNVVETTQFLHYNNAPLPYFGYVILRSATASVRMNGANLESLGGVRRQLGTTGMYLIDFTNTQLGNPSIITITSPTRLNVAMIQIGGGFSMSATFSNFLERPTAPKVTYFDNGSCTQVGATLTTQNTYSNYQWYYNGVAISGAILSTYTASNSGSYYVVTNLSCGSSVKSATTNVVINKKEWNGSVSTDWNNANNWSPAILPTNSDVIIVPTNSSNVYPIISGTNYNGWACNITVKNGANLKITSSNSLTVTNWVNVESGGTFLIENTASLVQINDVANTGNIIYKRDTNIRSLDYVYYSSPVANFNINNLSTTVTTGPKYVWNPTIANSNNGLGNWVGLSSNTMVAAQGYIVRGPSSFSNASTSTFTSTFVGVPNNGTINYPISRGSYTGSPYYGTNGTEINNLSDNFNLIGNPYPSSIRASQFLFNNNSVILGSVSLWTHQMLPSNLITNPFYQSFQYNYTANDYYTFNFTGTSCCPAAKSELFIGSGQGFFVKMIDGVAATSTVSFANSLRSGTYSNSTFFKNSTLDSNVTFDSEIENLERHRFWLDIVDNSSQVNDRTLIGYIQGASNDIDNLFDSETTAISPIAIYSLINNRKFNIQGKALPFNDSDEVPIGINLTVSGNFSIAIAAVDGLFLDSTIYLVDNLLSEIHDLKASPYSFSANAGVFNDRFKIIYNNSFLTNSNFGFSNEVQVVENNTINLKSNTNRMTSIIVYDVLGRKIANYDSINTNEFSLKGIKKNNEPLFLQIKLENDFIVNKKIIF